MDLKPFCCCLVITIMLQAPGCTATPSEQINANNNVFSQENMKIDAQTIYGNGAIPQKKLLEMPKEAQMVLFDSNWLEDLEDFLRMFQAKKTKWFDLSDNFNKISLSIDDQTHENSSLRHELETCVQKWTLILQDARNGSFYALKMLDSWARAESGILEGNVRWAGHYYECWSAVGPSIRGKWCNTYMGKQRPIEHPGIPLVVSWGSCFPRQCSDDAVRWVISALSSLKNLPPILETACPVPTYTYRTIDIIAIAISSCLALLVVCGSSLDIISWNFKQSVTSIKRRSRTFAFLRRIFLCFSIFANVRLLLETKTRSDTLPVLDGLRVISTTWIILSHWFYMMYDQVDNAVFMNEQFRDYISAQPLSNGTFAVDTFFFLSGLLVAYIGMKHLIKGKGRINIPLMYLQRYLRLTPIYAFLLLFSMSLYKFFGYGPYWNELAETMYTTCHTYWYANLLYINNIFPLEPQLCFGWSWYLANDMQFYILAPFLLLALYRWKRVGFSLIAFIFVGSVVTTGVLSKEANLQPTPVGFALLASIFGRFVVNSSAEITYEERFLTDTYNTPWCRICVYMVGMITGYLLYVNNRKIRMNKIILIVGWLVSFVVAMCLIYGLYGYVRDSLLMDLNISVLYLALCRPLWALCMAWVTIACTSGYGGPVTTFLNWKVFVPLSRLTYCAYLTHLLVIYWYKCVQEKMFHFVMANAVYMYLGTLVITFALSFGLCVCIEWPFMRLQKVLFEPLVQKQSAKAHEQHEEHLSQNDLSTKF